MVLCIVALFVFSFMAIFSAKYRPLAKEAFRCLFRTVTLKPCDTGLDDRIKVELVSKVAGYSPGAGRALNKHFKAFSWAFVLITIASFGYMVYGAYNFYYYGNCEGPNAASACIFNDLTGDYGRFGQPQDLIAPTELNGISAGNVSSLIKVIEFGCFLCPYTYKAEPLVQKILKEDVHYIFKPLPLPGHNNSYDAARAVLCADRQDKHWELRELVFSQQDSCAQGGALHLDILAQKAGLNMTQYKECMDFNQTSAELDIFIQQAHDAHIYATPSFFVNGRAFVGIQSLEDVKKAIAEEQAKVSQK